MLLHMPIVAKEWSYETMKQWYMRLEEVYIGEYIYIYIQVQNYKGNLDNLLILLESPQ